LGIELSVITSTWNLALLSRLCLYSILTQDFPRDKYEIIFVDDGSRDENGSYTNRCSGITYNFADENQGYTVRGVIDEVRERFPDVEIRYFYRDAPGWKSPCFAWNIGFKQARADIVLQIYSDHVMVGPVLHRLYGPHLHKDNLYVYTRKVGFGEDFRYMGGNTTPEGRLKYLRESPRVGDDSGYGALPWCYSVKKKWVMEVGGYDEYIDGEPILSHVPCDTAFMFRLKNLGLEFVQVNDAVNAKLPHVYDEGVTHEDIENTNKWKEKFDRDRHLVWENLKKNPTRANIGNEWGVDYTMCIPKYEGRQ
jgi:glycosyltransferase involved in cell wall biosynthesis